MGKDISDNVVRTWIHQHTVILGIHDSRLPFLKDGIDYLTNEIGYNAIVNNLWLRCRSRSRCIKYIAHYQYKTETTIDEAFTVMHLLISKMFEDENVDIYTMEIEHSYFLAHMKIALNNHARNLQDIATKS